MKDKRKVILIVGGVVLVLVVALLVAFNQRFHFLADETTQLTIYGVSPNKKLIKHVDLGGLKSNYSLTMARNEYEPFVLSLRNDTSKAITAGVNKPVLAGYNFEFYHVLGVQFGYDGYYQRDTGTDIQPDALVPMSEDSSFNIAPGGEEFIWVNVFASKDAGSGTKQASISLKNGQTFALKIDQISTTLPDKSTFSSIAGFNPIYAYLAHGYDEATADEKSSLINSYLSDFSEHRISPYLYSGANLSSLSPDNQVYWDFDATAADPHLQVDFSGLKTDSIKNSKYKLVNIAPYFYATPDDNISLKINSKPKIGDPKNINCADYTACPKYDLAVREFFSSWQTYLEENNLLDDTFYNLANELPPDDVNINRLAHLVGLAKQAAPKIKIAMAYTQESQVTLNKFSSALSQVDIWIASLNSVHAYSPTKYLPQGKQLWLSDANGVYRTDAVPEQYRMLAWTAYKMGATGIYYWSSNQYVNTNPWAPRASYRYGTNFLYYPPYENKDWVATQDSLTYTNASNKIPAITKSIRFEMIREGNEDVELFRQIEKDNSKNPETAKLMARIQSVSDIPLTSPENYSQTGDYSVESLQTAGKIVLDPNSWVYSACPNNGVLTKCIYNNREVSELTPGLPLTPSGKATITIDSLAPGNYKLAMRMSNYSSSAPAPKEIGSNFKMSINGNAAETYNYYGDIQDTWPVWLKDFWNQDKNILHWNPEIATVTPVNGVVTLQLEPIEESRVLIFGVELRQMAEGYGTDSILAAAKDMVLSSDTPQIESINISENQVITANPYEITVKVKDPSLISKVDFYIDNNLIDSSTLPDLSSSYSANWDTSKYHSTVKVVATRTDGKTEEITRNTTVNLGGGGSTGGGSDQQIEGTPGTPGTSGSGNSPIVSVLPKTGSEQSWFEKMKNYFIDLVRSL